MFSITTPLMVVVPISIPITFINIVLQYKNKFPITPISLPFLFRQAYRNLIYQADKIIRFATCLFLLKLYVHPCLIRL